MLIVKEMGDSRVVTRGRIRPCIEDDLPGVVDLYLKVFPQGRQYSRNKLHARFNRVLLQNPWYDASIPSLVYEKDDKVIGFLGVVVRPMLLGAEVIRVAVCNHFMVDPGARWTKAGIELLHKHFSGPQDLSIAEAGDASRKLWEAVGGRTSLGYSLYWTRLLCPARYSLYQLEKKAMPRPLVWLIRPICSAVDALAVRIKQNPLYQIAQPPEEELSEGDLLACLARFPRLAAFRPHYDACSLNWLLTLLAEKQLLGTLRKVAVRGSQREIIGWYIYYLKAGGVSTVLQMSATRGHLDRVFQHLCYNAWRHGSIALTGRLEPRFTKDLCDNHCLLHWRSWMLVHSRDSKILEALDNKETFFSPLEGESWISVEGELPDNIPS